MPRIVAPISVLLVLLATTACSDLDSITDVAYPPVSASADSAAPTVTLTAPVAPFQVGDSLFADVADDQRIGGATFLILDARDEILFSDSLAVRSLEKELTLSVPVPDLPRDFPYGDTVYYTVRATDAVGKQSYPGETGTQETKLEDAEKSAFVVSHGRLVPLAPGGEIGSFVLDRPSGRIYFTDSKRNRLGVVGLDSLSLLKWSVAVGSVPGPLALFPSRNRDYAELAVFNDGGRDVSLVSLYPGGGTEDRRLKIPYLTAIAASLGDTAGVVADTMLQRGEAHSLLMHCPDNACEEPVLYLGSKGEEGVGGDFTLTRTLQIRDGAPLDRFGVLTAPYQDGLSDLFTRDFEIDLAVFAQSSTLREDSLIYQGAGLSGCGTLGMTAVHFATTDQPGGPVFVGGQPNERCGELLHRYEWDGASYALSAASAYHAGRDPALRNVRGIDTNEDGSLVLVVTEEGVVVTNSDLRRLATLKVPGASSAAFLEGMKGGPWGGMGAKKLIALAVGSEVQIFETDHFTRVATLYPAQPVSGRIHFLEIESRGTLALIGTAESADAFVVVETTWGELQEMAAD